MSTREHLTATLSLHRAFSRPDQGFCWSPYSVFSALGLAAAGAGGRTWEELAAALRGGTAGELDGVLKLLSDAAELGSAGPGATVPELAVSNTLWAREDLPLRDSYRASLHGWPGSAVRHAPFPTDAESARRTINADVRDTTRGLIPELLDPGAVDADTVAALVNALYLRASWVEPFPESSTADRDFHAPFGTRRVPTMETVRSLGHRAAGGWQSVVLPAVGEVEAAVLLPDDDLATAEPRLDADLLADLLAAESTRVELRLPRFEVTGNAELTGPLGSLGVRSLFTEGADLSGISPERITVSAAVHQAVLRVDEHGFEGAAATAMIMKLAMITPAAEPVQIHVDRPFLFVVRHRSSGAVYFLARVVDPS